MLKALGRGLRLGSGLALGRGLRRGRALPVGPGLSRGIKGFRGAALGRVLGLGAAAALVTGASPAAAQSQWWPVRGFERNGDYEGSVNAVLAPTGPYQGELWIAGEFEHVQGTRVGGVARYRGSCYEPVGVPPTRAHGLVQFDGDIYIYGDFTEIDGRPVPGIARWDGSDWVSLGLGVNGQVRDAVVSGNELVCVGDFAIAGGHPSSRIAAWDGDSWRAWPVGLAGTVRQVRDIAGTVTVTGTNLQAPGITGASILGWAGGAWRSVGGATNFIIDVTEFGGSLVVSADDGPAPGAPLGISAWTGTEWIELGNSGVGFSQSLSVHSGTLIATSEGRARLWDGSEWQSVANGLVPLTNRPVTVFAGALTTNGFDLVSLDGDVSTLGVKSNHEDQGIVGDESMLLRIGAAREGRSGRSNTRLWEYRRGAWQDIAPVPALANIEGVARTTRGLFAYGFGLQSRDEDGVGALQSLSGDSWSIAADTVPYSVINAVGVSALVEFEDSLVAGGSFSAINGVPANNIARLVGDSWQSMGSGLNGLLGAWVTAMTVYEGQLIVGLTFEFNPIPGTTLVYVWNGTAFVPLGTGLAAASNVPAKVDQLFEYEGELYASGRFRTNDAIPIEGVARWDGLTWRALGAGLRHNSSPTFPALVRTATISNGVVVATGQFATLGDMSIHLAATWDGETWSSLPAGIDVGINDRAYAVAGELMYAGDFRFAGDQVAFGLARFGPTPPPHDADLSGSTDPSDPAYGVPDGLVDAADFFFFLDRFQQLDYPICDLAGDSDPASPCYSVPDGVIDLSDLFAYLDRMVN